MARADVSSLAALVGDLRAEARRTNERRLLVLQGTREACYESMRETLAAAGVDRRDTTLVGDRDFLPVERVSPRKADALLGTTTTVAVIDAHDAIRPNALGRTVGTVDGGGLLVLLAPPLGEWPDRRDEFDVSLAVVPYDVEDVSGAFRTRLIELLQTHSGIAIVDADSHHIERDGLTHPAPVLRRASRTSAHRPPGTSTPFDDTPAGEERGVNGGRRDRDRGDIQDDQKPEEFPAAVYDWCLTADQERCVRAFERLRGSKKAVVAEADRGRGKSSAAGLAAGALAARGETVLVTAPSYRATAELFDRATAVLDDLGVPVTRDDEANPRVLDVEGENRDKSGGSIQFVSPTAAVANVSGRADSTIGERAWEIGAETGFGVDFGIDIGVPDVVFVDEAAGLPVSVLDGLLAADRLAFTTTVHGYEGTGRGFAIRFRERLAASEHEVREVCLDDPIRYAAGDPVEVWVVRALLLDARPPVESLVADATPEAVGYERLSTEDLLADEGRLREVFGLLVAAHYRTEPNDLARLLCAPNLLVRTLTYQGRVVAVCLLAREGGLPPARRRDLYEGGRIKGHMLPDVLTSQLCDEHAGELRGVRVVRIATHAAVRSRGLGSHLLDGVRAELAGETTTDDQGDGNHFGRVDWLGVSYGSTPELIDFWRENGFRTVYVSTTPNETSGEHSALMLAPLTDRGETLTKRHTRWFARRFPAVLSDALSALDPDVARGALASAGVAVEPDLTARDWRMVCKAAYGSGLYNTDPTPFRRLALAYFTDRDAVDSDRSLSARAERLLVCRVFQARPPTAIARRLDYDSERQCLRALGDAYTVIVDRYGGRTVRTERDRYR